MLKIDFFHMTDAGCVRDDNEDSIGSWPYGDGFMFAVADGLGGHNAGQVASALALDVLSREVMCAPPRLSVQNRLRRSVQAANLEIYNKGMVVPELRRMGTTLTASTLTGCTLVAAHVGDCRLYLLRDGALIQLTKDHTWVWEQMQYGILSPEEARNHPNRHVLSRCLGHDLIPSIDILSMDLKAGDVLVQCSDGVHGMISEEEILESVIDQKSEEACRAIIERSREAGGEDNMSIQVASIISCPAPAQRSWWRFGH